MAIISFINLKGGVAKTTNAVAVAECLATSGYRTLLIDADHQCSASEMLLGMRRLMGSEKRGATLHDLLRDMLRDDFSTGQLPTYVQHKCSDIGMGLENLSVIPCSIRIDDFQTNAAKAQHGRSASDFMDAFRKRRGLLRKWINANYDYAIIDCPPSIPIHVRQMVQVSEAFVLPCIPDYLSIRGAFYLSDRLLRINSKIQGLGTLWSLYRKENRVHRRYIEMIATSEEAGQALPSPFETIIPNATAISASTEFTSGRKSFSAKYEHRFAEIFESLTEEIIQRSQWILGNANGETGVPSSPAITRATR